MSQHYFIGDNYYFGKNGSIQNFTKAVHYFQISAKNDNVNAMYMLGICYYNGTGVEKSVMDAIWYWNMAYEFGEENHACYELGCAYYLGEGALEKDPTTAFRFWKMSADNGNYGSMVEVGNSYYHGDGVDKNIDEALHYWCMARKFRKNSISII